MKNLQQHQHFSHHHALVPLVLDEGEELYCSGCDAEIEEPFHGCISCNYFLHDNCLNTPRFLQHPSHSHPLTLLPTPTYPGRFFNCDACGSQGQSFSLSCAQCECDLHLQCAALPQTLLIPDKHDHQLKLLFGSPNDQDNTNSAFGFVCDICEKEVDPNLWLYYCADCDFGVHLDCATPSETGSRGESAAKTGGGEGEVEEEEKEASGPEEEAVSRNSVYEIQRKLKEQDIANRLVLQALDNAADYVGSSYKKYYYY